MKNLIKDIRGNRPLLIAPTQAKAYLEQAQGIELPLGAKMSDMGDMLAAIFGEKPVLEKFPPYAIVPIKGVIGRNLTEMEALCGACDISDVEEMLEECERDPSIKTIILDIDSPGGTSVGVPELANRVKNSAKQVIGFTAGECCSAAYWIGSQASAGFYATPSSSVGSVGCYICYTDSSKLYAAEGLAQIVVKSGLYKGAGIEGTSLSEPQLKMLQGEVDSIHSDFKEAVKSVREFVEDSAMDGQIYSGKAGAVVGMVTELVNGFDELMESLNAQVAEQMEADEGNDTRHEISELGEMAEEQDPDGDGMLRMASGRALKGISKAVLLAAATKASNDDDEEGDPDEEKGAPPFGKAGKLPVQERNRDPQDPLDPQDDPDEEPEGRCVVSDFDGTIRVDDSGMLDEAVGKHLAQMSESGKMVHIVTGRYESRRAETAAYLAEHGIKHEAMHMKPDASEQSTADYKVDAVKKIEGEHGKIKHIVENDLECIKAYEGAGYACIHPDTLGNANDAADSGERAVDTDKKADKGAGDRHRGGTLA